MSNETLLPCPCGATPTKLDIAGEHERAKWARCQGDCCSEWSVEYRNNYTSIHSDESMVLAVKAWNTAPRGGK